MIIVHFTVVLLFALPVWTFLRLRTYRAAPRSFSLAREALVNAFFFYLLAVVSMTLFPLWIGHGHGLHGPINFEPIVQTVRMFQLRPAFALKNVSGNLALLAPLGLLLPLLWPRFRSAARTVLIGLIVSLGIETLQYLLPGIRITDIDDVILNTLGVAAGYALYHAWRPALTRFEPKSAGRKERSA